MFPPSIHSNCPLAVLWLWLAGRAEWIVATRGDLGWLWPWHFGAISKRNPEIVYHFKRTRDGQPWAPFWFEGRVLTASTATIERSRRFLWKRRAIYVVPLIAILVAVGLPVWMLVAAAYWPLWLIRGAAHAIERNAKRNPRH